MAFDETGPGRHASTRKVAICERAYRLLTEQVGLPPEDIIFDPNIFAVATGIEEHNALRHRLHRGDRGRSRSACPGAKISGGVSNLSFSFRGNDAVREAMHSAFLYHAITAGMDMGIVNAGQLAVYEEIPKELLRARRGRALQPPPRRDRAAGGLRRDGARAPARPREVDLDRGARAPSRSGWRTRS